MGGTTYLMPPKKDLTFTRDLLLKITLVLKVVPVSWVYALNESYEIDKKIINNIIHSMRRNGFISFEQKYPGERFIFLTQKGFDRASKQIKPNYSYKSWSKGATRTETIFRHHHYITFRFLLDYISNSETLANVYVDYDRDCKLGFKVGNHEYNIYPDALIRSKDQDNYHKIICLEADTGQEEIKRIFDKLLRYLIYIHKNFSSEDITQLKIYFSFATSRRAESVFKPSTEGNKNGVIYSLYNQGTRMSFLYEKTQESLGIREFFDILKSSKIELYFGTIENTASEFEKVEFLENILASCPKTAELYKQLYSN